MRSVTSPTTIVCFSHLRWHFVYQRPQHLISRAALGHTVYFIEEPVPAEGESALAISRDSSGVIVVTPQVSDGRDCRPMLDLLFSGITDDVIAWFYTPMMLHLAESLSPCVTVFDCMDELSAFKFASPEIKAAERRLLKMSDVVFTGGESLYEAKRSRHHNVHCFPSSVDAAHFGRARRLNVEDPVDQRHISRPRLGFFGVIDERFDCELLEGIADLRPEWSFVMIGPVVKIDPESLPQRANIHWLGGRDYKYLPQYLAHWGCGIMPFAINEATRFISPTKTPEFLAAGLPVVSTPIRDVVSPYGKLGLVEIASTPGPFVECCAKAMSESPGQRRASADAYLQNLSWDKTWAGMQREIDMCRQPALTRSMSTPALLAKEGSNVRV